MALVKSNLSALTKLAAQAVSRLSVTITRTISTTVTQFFRLISLSSFRGGYFIFDVFLHSSTILFVLTALGTNGPTFLSAESIAWRYSHWYILCWALALTCWAFGYMERTPRVYWGHLMFAFFRVSFCLTTLAIYVYYRIDIRFRGAYEPSLLLGMVCMAALLHWKLAVDRISRYRKLQAETHVNVRDYRDNIMTGTAMSYWNGPLDRSQEMDHAAKYMTKASDEDKFWYHPLVMISQREGTKLKPRIDLTVSPSIALQTPLFSRCYCCLDDDQDTGPIASHHSPVETNDDTEMLTKHTQWAAQKDLFMQQPQQCHSSYLSTTLNSESANHLGNAFNPHQLCSKCAHMAENSFLIQLLSGWTWSTYRRFVPLATNYTPFVEEDFEHWSTPSKMQAQVQSGCHLCTMIWDTMSREQQTQLLAQDANLSREMGVRIEQLRVDRDYDEGQVKYIQASYHRQRCIRLKIRSPYAHKDWSTAWASRHSYQSLRLIPHFGGKRIPRRWMKDRLARRAISLGQDPTLDWDQEHVDGLEIASTRLDNRGPICIPMSTHTGSDATMQLIKSWISSESSFRDEPSVDVHEQQESSAQDIPLQALDEGSSTGARPFRRPTRLIDVGSIEDDKVRLRLSSTIDCEEWLERPTDASRSKEYVALSHSWGSRNLLRLTESTLSTFQEGIPLAALPPTFRDAVSVVRRVGLRLLWIDSLCIIQDSKEDWRREAAQMKDIYANAAFVIAAVASWTSTDSFFVPQSPLAANPCLLGVRGQLSALTGSAPASFGGIYVFPQRKYTDDAWDEVNLSRLYSRAWCYQEECLAKRIVYFGDHQVHLRELTSSGEILGATKQVQWTSSKDIKTDFPDLLHPPLFQAAARILGQKTISLPLFQFFTELLSRRLPETPVDAGSDEATRSPLTHFQEGDISTGHPLLTESWWHGVGQYTDRYLTFEEDKLQAFSGIAHRFKSRGLAQDTQVQYLAGLWACGNEYLATGLLWYVFRHPPEPRSALYRAPSWSWASVDGRICNSSLSGSCSAEATGIQVLQYSVEGPSVDSNSQTAFPMGQCTGGFIVVRGKLQRARWAVLEASEKRYYVERPGEDDYVSNAADLKDFASWSTDPVSGPEARSLLSESGIRVGYLLPDIEGGAPVEVYCLQIIVKPEIKADQEDFGAPWATRGLALVPTGLATNEYRRVGYFELDRTAGGLSFPHRFSKGRRRARRWPPPNIDVARFFDGSLECEIVIR